MSTPNAYTPSPSKAMDDPPSYSKACKSNPAPPYRATEPPMKKPQSVTDPHPGDDEQMAAMRAWAKEKEHQLDYWGGHKGMAVGEPTDPFKAFRWAKRKLSHQPTEAAGNHAGASSSAQNAEANPDPYNANGYAGEYQHTQGDMDTSKIL